MSSEVVSLHQLEKRARTRGYGADAMEDIRSLLALTRALRDALEEAADLIEVDRGKGAMDAERALLARVTEEL